MIPPDLCAAFRERYGPGPVRVFFAPGRVNLIGAHVDYNGGVVLPFAIDLGVYAAVRPSAGRRIRLASRDFAGGADLALEDLERAAPHRVWSDYPVGALARWHAQRPLARGIDFLYAGTVPAGAGLSSSAALLVATLHAVRALTGADAPDEDLAQLAYQAETGFAQARIGRMDQLASALCRPGEALLLDFRDGHRERVPLPTERMSVLVLDSSARHQLRSSRQAARVEEARSALALLRRRHPELLSLGHLTGAQLHDAGRWLPSVELRRARHVVTEIERVLECRSALRRGDLATAGHLVSLSHASSRNDYDTSTPELDALQEALVAQGDVFGARLSGGGFGGCVVALVTPGSEQAIAADVGARFARTFGFVPACHCVRPGGGLVECDEPPRDGAAAPP